MKSILIIGMGKFGHHLCADLIKNGNDIMVMDKDEAKVRDLIYDVTKVQIGDLRLSCGSELTRQGISLP